MATTTALKKGYIFRKGDKFMRIVSTGKSGTKVQYRTGTRGRYKSETETVTSTNGWKLINGD